MLDETAAASAITHESKIPLLWADDEIDKMEQDVARFEAEGFEVATAHTTDEARQKLSEKAFSVALVDLLMPSEFGHALIEEILEKYPQVKAVVVSGYLGKSELNKGDFFRNSDIAVFEKDDIPSPGDPKYKQEFIEPIKKLVHDEASTIVQRTTDHNLDRKVSSVLKMTFDEYKQLRPSEKLMFKRLARKSLDAILQQNFRKGAIWVLVLGDRREIITADQMKDVLTWPQIRDKCERANVAPFQFFAELQVDDISWGESCVGELKNYPTVTLACVSDVAKRRPIHFDTGCPLTIVVSEAAEQLSGEAIDDEEQVSLPINGQEIIGYRLILRCNVVDATNAVIVNVHYIAATSESWYEHPLARKCSVRCSRQTSSIAITYRNSGVCHYRWGLVGRNLLTETGIKLIFDGANRQTAISL